MVCRNCGADLKPGVKYCLECGNYIDEEEEASDEELQLAEEEASTEYNAVEEKPKKSKKKKFKLKTADYLIYGGLILIMVVSIIIIIVTAVNNNSNKQAEPQQSPVTVKQDQKVDMDDYTVVVPGELYSTVQDSFLYVTDNTNYKFSFQNKEDEFDKYRQDQNLLKDQLVNSNHEVVSVYEKTVNNRLFLLYDIKVEGNRRVLYLTKINSKYTTFGTIEIFENGNWEEALPQIDTICNSVTFNND